MGATPLGPTLGDRAGVLDIRTRNKSVGPKLGERVQNQCGSAYRSRRTSSSNMVPRSRTGDEIGRCSVTKRNQFFTAEMIFARKWKGIRKPSMFQKKEFGRKTRFRLNGARWCPGSLRRFGSNQFYQEKIV